MEAYIITWRDFCSYRCWSVKRRFKFSIAFKRTAPNWLFFWVNWTDQSNGGVNHEKRAVEMKSLLVPPFSEIFGTKLWNNRDTQFTWHKPNVTGVLFVPDTNTYVIWLPKDLNTIFPGVYSRNRTRVYLVITTVRVVDTLIPFSQRYTGKKQEADNILL